MVRAWPTTGKLYSGWLKPPSASLAPIKRALMTLMRWDVCLLKDNTQQSHSCCVSIHGLHPLEANYATRRLSQSEGSSKCSPQMRPSFLSFLRMHSYNPSQPHISQYSLGTWKRRKKERKWRHRVAYIVSFTGLGGRNRDVRTKHLVMEPGSVPKARPSYLTRPDVVNKVSSKDSPSKTTKAGSFEGCRPWLETQQVCSPCRHLARATEVSTECETPELILTPKTLSNNN